MPEPISAYKVLQVDAEAEDEVIQAAYRRLARKYHPDLAGGAEAAARMSAINVAWELIGSPVARAAYDQARAIPEPEAPTRRGGPTGDAEVRRGEAGPDGETPSRAGRPAGGPAEPGGRTPPGGQPRPTATPPRQPETVSRDWTSGRSTQGGGFDASMRAADGLGAAGPPPGRPSGSVLNFGRYSGWSLGEIARRDIEFIEWLDRTPIGRTYRDEIDTILRAAGRRRSADAEAPDRRGLFRRR
jgi:curved DNA-binding protein CbpA